MIVKDTFVISNKLVVVGDHGLLSPLHSGDTVTVITPAGKELEAQAFINLPTPNPRGLLSLTLEGLGKEDVPIGSEILWGWF